MSALKENMVRQVETTINNGNKRAAQLEEELEGVWAEIEEARDMLHFLKTGKERTVREAPRTVERDAPTEPEAEPRQRRPLRSKTPITQYEEAITSKLGSRTFTPAEVAEAVGGGVTRGAANEACKKMAGRGFLVRVQERRANPNGIGWLPSEYRVKRSA